MAYQFVNRSTGKSQVTDENDTTYTLNGINTQSNDANAIHDGLTILLGIVGWTVAEANRIVTQDIEET